jgi:hypothetical protein
MGRSKWPKALINGYNHQKRRNQINKNVMKLVNKKFLVISVDNQEEVLEKVCMITNNLQNKDKSKLKIYLIKN